MTEKGARRSQLDVLYADSSSEYHMGNLNAVLACGRNIKAKLACWLLPRCLWTGLREVLGLTRYPQFSPFEFQVEKNVFFLLEARQKNRTYFVKVQILPRWITKWLLLGKENFPTDQLIINFQKNFASSKRQPYVEIVVDVLAMYSPFQQLVMDLFYGIGWCLLNSHLRSLSLSLSNKARDSVVLCFMPNILL